MSKSKSDQPIHDEGKTDTAGPRQSPADPPSRDRRPVTVKEYAEARRVNRKTVYRAIHRGEIQAIQVGRAIRILCES